MGKGILSAVVAFDLLLALAGCGRGTAPLAPATGGSSPWASSPRGSLPYRRPIRAAYFYSYLSASHLDSLAGAGLNRAIVKFTGDSLGPHGRAEMAGWVDHAARARMELVPAWSLQAPSRLAALRTTRRYTWGAGVVEPGVGCPLDSLFWRSALLDRAEELLASAPGVRRLALDLEIYTGTPHHYVEACGCPACRTERAATSGRASGGFDESRLAVLLERLLDEFARAHPGVELGVLDLDRDSFVHRAMARALVRAHVPTLDYTERTYSTGGVAVSLARSALEAIGVRAPVVGGLWLKTLVPGALPGAVRLVVERSDGYFVFSTFSLWAAPEECRGPYALQGTQAEYWRALREANR